MSQERTFDVLVIGGGPAGMKAAVQAAKAGRSVAIVEREPGLGGECVHRGTIPSKTMRETAVCLAGLRSRTGGAFDVDVGADVKVATLMQRLKEVLDHYEDYLGEQMSRNNVEHLRGRARFIAPGHVALDMRDGAASELRAGVILIATGSRPRHPDDVPVDHEQILDSDSILSLIYLPRSLTILGGGVIACEFASLFAALGVEVTMLDKRPRPLGFIDPELTDRFIVSFEANGGRFVSGAQIESVQWDGVSRVITKLEDGTVIRTEKCLCALGRVASVAGLDIERAGIELDARGHIPVDQNLQTRTPGIYAAGDVIGPPALAATAMDQGRRAVRNALGLPSENAAAVVPIGIYTIPEIACVGESEEEVTARLGSCVVGRSPFNELARGHISGNTSGFFKLVCDDEGRKVLGAHIFGEGATELVHVAQLAIYANLDADAFLENVFNYPTLAECFRVAALDVVGKRAALEQAA